MPISTHDLEWWQWLICGLVCWLVGLACRALADESQRRQYIAFRISFWLGMVAGGGCTLIGITLSVRDAPYIEWWQWLICAIVFWFVSIGFSTIAGKFERDKQAFVTIFSWVGVLAGLDCAALGIIRLIKGIWT